jgi:hypothetical protein
MTWLYRLKSLFSEGKKNIINNALVQVYLLNVQISYALRSNLEVVSSLKNIM